MSRVVSRWVMPKTMEANKANTVAALKCVRVMVNEVPQIDQVSRLQSFKVSKAEPSEQAFLETLQL